MNILGINAFHGDASAALLSDGQLVVAIEEERFNRIKHWAGLPLAAARRPAAPRVVARQAVAWEVAAWQAAAWEVGARPAEAWQAAA